MTDEDVLLAEGDERVSDSPKFRVGDTVRLSKVRSTFHKSFTQNYTDEIFVISRVNTNSYPVYYNVKSVETGEEPIQGTVYTEEMIQSEKPPAGFAKIERIIRKRLRRGRRESLVKWIGYSPRYNEWVNDDDIVKL